MALVAYAPAGTRPSPLVARTFFGTETLMLMQHLPDALGSGAGGLTRGQGRGFAALEALAAALEVRPGPRRRRGCGRAGEARG
jgi:hypothetical protein